MGGLRLWKVLECEQKPLFESMVSIGEIVQISFKNEINEWFELYSSRNQ